MATYYVIKTHYTPTETNPTGVEHDYYSGKAGFTMNTEHCLGDMSKNQLWDCQYALEHAYTRKCDAIRSLKNHQRNNADEAKAGHWVPTSEIITIEREWN